MGGICMNIMVIALNVHGSSAMIVKQSISVIFHLRDTEYFFFAENKNHDDDTDDSDDDNIFGDEVAPIQIMPKQQTSSTSSQGRYRKYVKKSLQVFDIVDHIPTYY